MPRDALQARFLDRFADHLRPGWLRSILVRRVLSGALVVLAVLLVVIDRSGTESASAVVAARDLRPGMELTAGDVAVRRIPLTAMPPGAVKQTDEAIGARLTGHLTAGEVLTASRILSSRLPADLTGRRDARLVPVRPSDSSVVALLRPGDLVDVLDDHGDVLAAGAVVTVGTGEKTAPTTSDGSILLAMSEAESHRVAGTGLSSALTVILH